MIISVCNEKGGSGKTTIALNIAVKLGLLKEVINAHEDYELEAMEFYKKCAEKEDSPTPVRALCLTNLIEINNNY